MTTESEKKERLKAPIAARLWAVPVGRGNPSGVFLSGKEGTAWRDGNKVIRADCGEPDEIKRLPKAILMKAVL